MARQAVTISKFNRISLNLTVPRKISKVAWDHLLVAVEQFEKKNDVAVVDLDMKSLPFVSR
jgi:hypothetical protein